MTVAFDKRADHAQYLGHWLNVMKADKKAIFTAASEASEAAAFLAALVFRIKAERGPPGAA
jgi:antirestriction protein ArdC